MYLDHFRRAFSLSGNFGVRPKFRLSETTSRFQSFTSAQQKAKSKSEVCLMGGRFLFASVRLRAVGRNYWRGRERQTGKTVMHSVAVRGSTIAVCL